MNDKEIVETYLENKFDKIKSEDYLQNILSKIELTKELAELANKFFSKEKLDQLKVLILGKNGLLTTLLSDFKNLGSEQRLLAGNKLNEFKNFLENIKEKPFVEENKHDNDQDQSLLPGSLVQLKSGSPTMTLGQVCDNLDFCWCYWYDENKHELKQLKITMDALKLV